MEKLKHITGARHALIDAVENAIADGIESVDAHELGAVIDMIKDLAKAEKDCWEACYYEHVMKAMDDWDGKPVPMTHVHHIDKPLASKAPAEAPHTRHTGEHHDERRDEHHVDHPEDGGEMLDD